MQKISPIIDCSPCTLSVQKITLRKIQKKIPYCGKMPASRPMKDCSIHLDSLRSFRGQLGGEQRIFARLPTLLAHQHLRNQSHFTARRFCFLVQKMRICFTFDIKFILFFWNGREYQLICIFLKCFKSFNWWQILFKYFKICFKCFKIYFKCFKICFK